MRWSSVTRLEDLYIRMPRAYRHSLHDRTSIKHEPCQQVKSHLCFTRDVPPHGLVVLRPDKIQHIQQLSRASILTLRLGFRRLERKDR
jgi:hypothetical protein